MGEPMVAGESRASEEGGWLAARLRGRFDPVLIVLSPPRCGSTAVARSLWRHPCFRWYLHEPCDRVHHRGGGRDSIEAAMTRPIDAWGLPGARARGGPAPTGIVVKEMTFQPGPFLPEVIGAATLPIVVTVRDPRLAISSRMRQRARGRQPAEFPAVESGWRDLATFHELATARGIPYAVVEVTRLRLRPAMLLPLLCERLGLPFAPEMLSWPDLGDTPLGGLDAEQRHWYSRVLTSTGFEPPTEEPPADEDFPPQMRPHVVECRQIYGDILTRPALVA
jgi:hypothetical protein